MTRLSDKLNEVHRRHGELSVRQVARQMADLGHSVSSSSVGAYLKGSHPQEPSEKVLAGFAAIWPELKIDALRELAGVPVGESDPYVPPAEVHRLSRSQRLAVDAVIRAMLETREDVVGDAAPTSNVTPLPTRPETAEEWRRPARPGRIDHGEAGPMDDIGEENQDLNGED